VEYRSKVHEVLLDQVSLHGNKASYIGIAAISLEGIQQGDISSHPANAASEVRG
jgi:hypothetical protein|tara:strand:+ start:309 stop:470 length:162 start_codon:yes stop_codon:yes gene_type:complete